MELDFVDLNLDMQTQIQKGNHKVVTKRKQEQSRATTCTEIPIVFSYEFGFLSSKRELKPNKVSFIMDFVDLNFDMQTQRQKGNRKAVTRRKREQSRPTAYTKISIAFSYGFCFLSSKRPMKPDEVGLFMDFVDLNLDK